MKSAVLTAVDAATAQEGRSPLAGNVLAVAVADALQKGRSRQELEEISKFLQLLQTALKSYM